MCFINIWYLSNSNEWSLNGKSDEYSMLDTFLSRSQCQLHHLSWLWVEIKLYHRTLNWLSLSPRAFTDAWLASISSNISHVNLNLTKSTPLWPKSHETEAEPDESIKNAVNQVKQRVHAKRSEIGAATYPFGVSCWSIVRICHLPFVFLQKHEREVTISSLEGRSENPGYRVSETPGPGFLYPSDDEE